MLRELGNKIEKMEKLSPGDLLEEVHEAAEELQMKIDEKSYLLIKAESWAASKLPEEFQDPDHFQELKDSEHKNMMINSLSEVALHLRSTHTLRNWDPHNPNMSCNPSVVQIGSTEDVFKQQTHWPSRLSVFGDTIINEREVKTYESASALSLATFTSLLMEFVARLQNLVNSFEELSEKAKFKEPVNPSASTESAGCCSRLCSWIFHKD